jgi:amino acid transporter
VTEPNTGLIRVIGRWTLTALVINSIIGSGIFGLPSTIAGLLGSASPYAYLLAAAGIGVIMACFAEVASQFREAGGPYLYARAAFGRFVSLQVGWLAWLVRLTAAAANANLFVDYLAEFWPNATDAFFRTTLLTLLIGGLTGINYRGVNAGAQTSNFFTIAKLLPLTLFIVAGIFLARGEGAIAHAASGTGDWPKALLLLMFAYGGFEAALMPSGEMKNPRRDAPFALFMALLACALFYTLVQYVVVAALAAPETAKRPLAEAARVLLGASGAAFITLGAMISVYGYLSSAMLNAPRLTFALAEAKDFPRFFAAIHPKFRTPHVSIVIFAALLLALTIAGTFQWNASLSAVARLFTYGVVCAALLKLRRQQPRAEAFRLPFGPAFAGLGILFALYLIFNMGYGELLAILATAALAFAHWLVAKRKSA